MAAAVAAVPTARFIASHAECVALVEQLENLATQKTNEAAPLAAIAPNNSPALVIIPCLNEAKNITPLVTYLLDEARSVPMTIVIADGGSSDGTIAIAQRLAAEHSNVHYLPNPKRIQSAAVNLAVTTYGTGHDYLIRIDAHAYYPAGFCATLLNDAARTGADSVVVSMHTVGNPGFQEAVAVAQNSKLGNGGSAHRSGAREGRFVEHGHHALMRIAAFNAVGGYDETFTHNEDAELDVRLRRAGHHVWLTAATTLDYFPRATPWALCKQYRNYGTGRARTLLKHRQKPRLRQILPLAVFPAATLLLFTPITWLAALPFGAYASLCLGYGALLAWRAKRPSLVLSGVAAMLMHASWSFGFWQKLCSHGTLRV
jgi:succinoglycan biosynthesis protein ExoA